MFAVINVICQIRKLSFFASITGMVFFLFVSSCHFNSIIYFIYAFCSRFLLLLYILLSSLNPVVIERSWRQNFRGVQVKNVANHSCVPPRESLKCAGLAESAFQRGCGRFCPVRCVYRPTALPREIPQACSLFLLRWCYSGQGLCVYQSTSPFQECTLSWVSDRCISSCTQTCSVLINESDRWFLRMNWISRVPAETTLWLSFNSDIQNSIIIIGYLIFF